MNKVVSRFIEAGIIKKIIKDYDEKNRISTVEVGGPEVLTLETLRASFEVWIYSVALSIIAFVIEFIVYYRRTIGKFLHGLFAKITTLLQLKYCNSSPNNLNHGLNDEQNQQEISIDEHVQELNSAPDSETTTKPIAELKNELKHEPKTELTNETRSFVT